MRIGHLSIFAIMMMFISACGDVTPVMFYNPASQASSRATKPNVVKLPSMKFYTATDAPMAECRRGIRADLQARGNRFTGVILRDFSEGSCENIAKANPRFYSFEIIGTQCGSVTYSGTLETSDSYSAIVFTDHADRKCTDHRPAPFELEETLPHSITRKFYGGWGSK